jgi:Stigma-specific protein, Stig1
MRKLLLVAASLLALSACKKDLVCPAGETACGNRCVSLLTDVANCGACGHACGALEACGAGTCACAPGVGTCGGACTDLARDPAHCGACDVACGAADYCTTASGATSCTASCPDGFTACGRSCVDLQTDRLDCGACGHACAQGETCSAGACRAAVHVACYASGDVRPVTLDLEPAGAPRAAEGSPTVLAATLDAVYAGNGFPAGLAVIPLDTQRATRLTVLPGDDVEGVLAYEGAVLVSNAGTGTLAVLDAAGNPLDEIVLPGDAPNPHGLAVLGSTAYVALYGNGPATAGGAPTGQKIAKVDLSSLPACIADTAPPACGADNTCPAGRECRDGHCRVRCGTVLGAIDLLAVPGGADAGAYPFPAQVAVRGTKVYVTLANLTYADLGGGFAGWFKPAGHGKLAVVDTAASDALSFADLGAACGNPTAIQVNGTTAWIACGSFSFGDLAPSALLPVDLTTTPVPGAALSPPSVPGSTSAFVPGNLAFCGGFGYVTDQASGAVLRFDPTARQASTPVTVCPTVYFALASDVACP